MPKVPEISLNVATLIEDPFGQSLLLQKRTGTELWGPIGGAVELGEGFLEAAYREIAQETRGVRVAIRGPFRTWVELSEEKVSVGVVFLGVLVPYPDDRIFTFRGSSVYDSPDYRVEDLLDEDADDLRFFGRDWIRGLVERPEHIFLPEKNRETLRRWVPGYTLPVVPIDIWHQAFVVPLVAAD